MKILIVEDEPLILMDVELQLLEAGHEVAVAENADLAVRMLAQSMFDLLLTDIDKRDFSASHCNPPSS